MILKNVAYILLCTFLVVYYYIISPYNTVFMPPPFIMGGGHIASPLSVRPYVRPVRTKNGFRAISFEYIGVLDSYFIHRYISIK